MHAFQAWAASTAAEGVFNLGLWTEGFNSDRLQSAGGWVGIHVYRVCRGRKGWVGWFQGGRGGEGCVKGWDTIP